MQRSPAEPYAAPISALAAMSRSASGRITSASSPTRTPVHVCRWQYLSGSVARNRGRTDEADRLDVWVFEERIDRLLSALDDIENALWKSGLGIAISSDGEGHAQAFENKAISAGDGDREHPHRHDDGKIERSDPGHYTQRLAQRMAVDTGSDILSNLPLKKMRRAHREPPPLVRASPPPLASSWVLPCSAEITSAS